MSNGKSAPKSDPLSPAEVLRLIEERAKSAQHELASRTDAGEDVLHYLALNGAPATRRAVAANPAAGPKSNRHLVDDEEDEVRMELAAKIGRLLPGLLAEERRHLRALTIETLELLARDEEPRVRAILAEQIKTLDCVPRAVVQRLATDVEIIVARPILEYSPLLADVDLLEIIASARANAVLEAIAKRKPVSADVADALVVTLDIPAISALIANQDAKLRVKTLDRIISEAARIQEWQMPLVLRADLSQRAIRRIASFVGAALIAALAERHDLRPSTRAHLNRELRARLEKADRAPDDTCERARCDVETAMREGNLNEAFVEAAAEAGRREHVAEALAVLARVPVETVRHILASDTARPITALVWRANLGMRVAFKIQSYVQHLRAGELLHARGGVHFPMSEDEMHWQLDYFGIRE